MAADHPSIHAGHRARMRSRFFQTGLDGFQPHEALELLLFCVIPKRDVNPLAHALLDRFGTLDAVLSASPEELAEVAGVGQLTGSFFRALNAFTQAYMDSRHHLCNHLATLADALRHVPESARKSLKYSVTILFADRMNRLLAVHSFPGRADAPMTIRSILAQALSLNAHNVVIFCSGYRSVTRPLSRHELASFHPLINALADISAFTVDCILLSRDHLLSLRKEKLLTGQTTELQNNLSRWDYWLGSIAFAQSDESWYPISLLEAESK